MSGNELQHRLVDFVRNEHLPEAYLELINSYLLPLADWIAVRKQPGKAFTLGVNGAQGSGKSTMTEVLSLLLQYRCGLTTARLSIDDLYLNQQQRSLLAKDIHPLLKTRGVPGTHDVQLGLDTLAALKQGRSVKLPRFDKGDDNPLPESVWPRCQGPVDIILFEGWCLGITSQPEVMLSEHINELEANEDPDCVWRTYVNEQLKGQYQLLCRDLDALLFLQTPGLDAVRRWRGEQEARLKPGKSTARMNSRQLMRFILHFERLTGWAGQTLVHNADIVFALDEKHAVINAHYR